MSSHAKCAHCGTANIIPHMGRAGSCRLEGALTLNGLTAICCRCLREFNALAAQTVRLLTKTEKKK